MAIVNAFDLAARRSCRARTIRGHRRALPAAVPGARSAINGTGSGRTGRCPIVLGHDALDRAGILEQPGDVIAAIDSVDPRLVLGGWWPGEACLPDCPCGEQLPAELPDDPAGASIPDLSRAPETIAAAARSVGGRGGWTGLRWSTPRGRPTSLLLVAVDRSRLHLTVAQPPTTDDECHRVAAEHVAFCPDQQDPQHGDFYTLGIYTRMIRDARSWSFWWD